MKNVECKIEGNILIITVDLTKEYGLSGTGKNTIIASSEGNQSIGEDGIKLGLNIYKKKVD